MSDALWRQVARSIEQSIRNQEFVPGDKLPTEAEFSKKYMVNRHTLRRALSYLQEKGLVESTQGRGSYVRRPALKYRIGRRTRFTDAMKDLAMEAKTKTHRLSVIPSGRDVALALEIKPGDKVIKLVRIGLVDDAPISMSTHYFSHERFPFFAKTYQTHLSVTQTLAHSGVLDFERKRTIVHSRLPFPDETELLNIPKHIPLLATRSWNVDSFDKPLEYGEAVFASDRVELDIAVEPIVKTDVVEAQIRKMEKS
ncbi:MAG: phosphonate metabolism transcriptional regulator PhnF [Pseudomonadota bacterium]